ncbi:MAG: SPOR domain-containing protein [Marinicellaceae bacterium]
MELALKQRLVGASVIIALAVIFIPMLFDNSNNSQNQSITINIPNEPEDLKNKVINIDTGNYTDVKVADNKEITSSIDQETENANNNSIIEKQETILDVVDNTKTENTPKQEATVPNSDEQTDPTAVKVDQVNSTDKPNKSDEIEKPAEKPVKEEPISSIKKDEAIVAYRVKYGVFSQQKNAQQLKTRIVNGGYSASVEEAKDKNLYTVYSQQINSKSEATRIINSIQKLKLNIGQPTVISLSENDALLAESMIDTGWILQIGSFANKENSFKLRDKIRAKGFVTFVDEITSTTNKIMYRVRIGPYATREEAMGIQVNVKNSLKLDSIIKPHEKQKVIN